MSKSGEGARRKIREAGVALLSADGLAGVSLGVLAQRVGMSKSGLFAHYRSKDELQIELLHASAELAAQVVLTPTLQAPAGLPRLRTLFGLWCGWSRRAGLPGGCPIAAAIFELDDVTGPVRDAVVELEHRWRSLLVTFVREAVAEGHLAPAVDIEQVAWELTGIYLAHHAALRLRRATDADARAQRAFERVIGSVSSDEP